MDISNCSEGSSIHLVNFDEIGDQSSVILVDFDCLSSEDDSNLPQEHTPKTDFLDSPLLASSGPLVCSTPYTDTQRLQRKRLSFTRNDNDNSKFLLKLESL